MKLAKYAKAIGAAVGSAVATVAGIHFGMDPEMISAQSVSIATAVSSLLTTVAVIISPKNKE